jgi:ketosteroid isomerase-like protein
MSQENVEIVRRGYGLVNSRDIEAWIALSHPNVEMHDLAVLPDAPVRRGHDAMREWIAMMDDIWTDARYEPEEFIDAGEFVFVAALGRLLFAACTPIELGGRRSALARLRPSHRVGKRRVRSL